jgi:Family of unknown function (DUF6527)
MSAAGKYLRRCSNFTLVAWCPGCKTHHPFDLNRWQFDGNLEAPTFSPSLLCNADLNNDSQRCHSFVRNGRWEFCSDCWHDLKNQSVPMIAINDDWEPIIEETSQ